MAFKMNYSFEGNSKSKPEQNLSGASKKLSRDVLLQKTQEERRNRHEQRLKLQSAKLLQSHIRSYIVRKRVKHAERQQYDSEAMLHKRLAKLLFFFDKNQDIFRLYELAHQCVAQKDVVERQMELDTFFAWSIKRLLVLCLKNCFDHRFLDVTLSALNAFAHDSQTVFYLIKKGYFTYLRSALDSVQGTQLEQIIVLISKPFKFLNDYGPSQDLVMFEFCNSFLKPTITANVKFNLFPYLKLRLDVNYYEKIINYLNNSYDFDGGNNLFYSILLLEPDNYEPNLDSIQVLAALSKYIYTLKPLSDLTHDDSDDEDEDRDMEQQILLSDYLHILNKPEKVRKWINFFEANFDNRDVLLAFVKLCQNLLLVYNNSIRKYLLLYKLGLNGTFLGSLWRDIRKKVTDLQLKGSSLVTWKSGYSVLAVFCDVFTFYTENLTDKENCDTSDTFSQQDLEEMSKLLKETVVDLIDVAYPMCRSSAVTATLEITHLYRACLTCVRILYMLDMRKHYCPSGFWTRRKFHVSLDLARKNYLCKPNRPFGGLAATMTSYADENEHLPPMSTIEQRSLAILQELPFLIPFNTRVLLLRDLCRYSVGENDYQRIYHQLMNDNTIVIRRNYLYEDAFEKISTKSETDFKRRLRIQFVNNIGLEEAGIDGGGIFKEFINEVLKTAFDPNRGFFLMTADNALYPNPNVHLIVSNFADHYNFIGRLVGKAIFENILVDLPLAEFFLAKLLVDRASAHYLKSLDPILYRNLLYLRDYSDGDVSDLGLDFTAVNNDLGETTIVELKPNGRNIPVVNENRLEYIQRLADFKLNAQLKKQCAAFREGLNSFVPLSWLKLFNHRELQVIVSGDTQEIDLSDLRAHTVYSGDFTSDHPTVLLFWKILYGFTELQKKQLLKFVTSCSRAPLLGFKELNPQFCIQSSGTENRMPTASTCLNLLKIPVIREEETLRTKILAAIEQNAGFELS
ncbi:ubiquitin-protein ligase E3C [Cylas formicarius]|uniref:ubiquitin-protein ligase E3C n=1 Tax=Cylas formicarius TaxID=197179 RepID=UPI0029584D48|nr:ubiquitin-protein ligase E3C [Cylas formicarius]